MTTPDWIVDGFGVAAGLCSIASFVPQIVKIVRERDAGGVSLAMYGVTILGFCCWVAYGLFKQAWPVAAANGVCVILCTVIFTLRLRFGQSGA